MPVRLAQVGLIYHPRPDWMAAPDPYRCCVYSINQNDFRHDKWHACPPNMMPRIL
jgi:hypothetical protein